MPPSHTGRDRDRSAGTEGEQELIDADAELLDRLTALRAAVTSRVASAEGITALRAAPTAMFERINVHMIDGALSLFPHVWEEALASTGGSGSTEEDDGEGNGHSWAPLRDSRSY